VTGVPRTFGALVQGTLDDKKSTMDYSLMMACLLVNTMNHEGRSALPDAPVVAAPRPGPTRRSLARLQGWLASALHPGARAIEPSPPNVTEPRQCGTAAVAADAEIDGSVDSRIPVS
jgi:hypothetical protein